MSEILLGLGAAFTHAANYSILDVHFCGNPAVYNDCKVLAFVTIFFEVGRLEFWTAVIAKQRSHLISNADRSKVARRSTHFVMRPNRKVYLERNRSWIPNGPPPGQMMTAAPIAFSLLGK